MCVGSPCGTLLCGTIGFSNRPFVVKRFLALLIVLLTAFVGARAADPTANKALFDRTVDRVNFQTMEGVYDARFARKKFPVNLKTRAERRDFKDFNGDAAFEKLFHNYNDEAEKYKNRFGNGAATLANFEKGLRGILVDANFEFFLAKAARREDRSALIRKLEGTIKQAVAQYDASGETVTEAPQPDTLAGAALDEDAATEGAASDAQVDELNQNAAPEAVAAADVPAAGKASGGGWSGTLALMLALAAAGGVAYLLFVVVPSVRAQAQQMALEAAANAMPKIAPAPDDALPATYAEEARHRAVELRFTLIADEVDELKGRVRELELRLADALAAPGDDVLEAPVVATVAPPMNAAVEEEEL